MPSPFSSGRLRSRPPVAKRRSAFIQRAAALFAITYAAFQANRCAFSAFVGNRARPPLRHQRTSGYSSVIQSRAEAEATSSSARESETFKFQAEVSKVMDIIINSLYSNKDIFLRELVSNAADACDKRRFLSLTQQGTTPDDMRIRIRADKERRTLSIEDNGVGMSKQELIANLGNVARSGTAEFVKQLGQGADDVSLIGQFGVGFYSAFLVADKVDVYSSSFTDSSDERQIWKWSSDGDAFSIEDVSSEDVLAHSCGTKLVLHLKEDAQEYLDIGSLSKLLKKYSEYITFPIEVWNERVQYGKVEAHIEQIQDDAKAQQDAQQFEWKRLNTMKPIWLRSPDLVNQSDYTEFYRAAFNAFDEPMTTTHFQAEGQVEFRAVVFIPTVMPFELARDMFAESSHAMRLYVKQVFINDNFQELVPRWLTFARGVVDSEDLPLNVGREILQKSISLQIIRKRIARKVLDSIADLQQNDPTKFNQLWNTYGKYFKVGLVEDVEYKHELKHVVRFFSSKEERHMVSFADYVSRMKEGQNHIYYVTGDGRKGAEIAPAMEKMKLMDYEVLYMIDPLDEICAQSIHDFDGHTLVNINKADLEFNRSDEETQDLETKQQMFESVAAWLKKELGENVQKVQISDRLVDSPAVLVQGEWGLSPMMQRFMMSQAADNDQQNPLAMGARSQAILEINPRHPVIVLLKESLEGHAKAQSTRDIALMIFETAALIGGYSIEDPGGFAKRVTKLMETIADK